MPANVERKRLTKLAEEAKLAAREPGLRDETRSLLDRVSRALTIAAGRPSPAAGRRAELESIAGMIEAESAIWPEEVERLASLAARVRERRSP